MDTIFAVASGSGTSGVAVIRVSGPGAGEALEALTGAPRPAPRRAVLRTFCPPGRRDEPLDRGLILWFPGPNSFTGEDVTEFHIHGGRAVVQAFLSCLGGELGLRLAEPGEFTRRAFENGRLDLTEVEGLADLIHAQTERQRRQAFRQMDGDLGRLFEGWRSRLIHILAHVEAEIDFPDEDLPDDVAAKVFPDLDPLIREMDSQLADGRRGELLRDGVSVAIVGPPNAGKSTLLNALARRDVAIVSQEAGTTRDVIEVHLDLNGFPVTVADTAGVREAEGEIESEGIRRAVARARDADLRIGVLDGSKDEASPDRIYELLDPKDLLVLNKSDLTALKEAPVSEWTVHQISAKTGDGMRDLLSDLEARVTDLASGDDRAVLTRLRHRANLELCVQALKRARTTGISDVDLMAEDLRQALHALGRVVGSVDVEDILDVVFKDFCLGK